MTLRNLTQAVARRLAGLWPERQVYVDGIPKGADGNFFVGIVESDQTQGLGRRMRRTVQFQVLYFLHRHDSMAFQDWAEAMYDGFDRLEVREGEGRMRTVRLSGQRARDGADQGVYQFLFEADLFLLLAQEPAPTMEHLDQREDKKT